MHELDKDDKWVENCVIKEVNVPIKNISRVHEIQNIRLMQQLSINLNIKNKYKNDRIYSKFVLVILVKKIVTNK